MTHPLTLELMILTFESDLLGKPCFVIGGSSMNPSIWPIRSSWWDRIWKPATGFWASPFERCLLAEEIDSAGTIETLSWRLMWHNVLPMAVVLGRSRNPFLNIAVISKITVKYSAICFNWKLLWNLRKQELDEWVMNERVREGEKMAGFIRVYSWFIRGNFFDTT